MGFPEHFKYHGKLKTEPIIGKRYFSEIKEL